MTFWISSWRGTSAPAIGEHRGVERVAEQEEREHDDERGDRVAGDVDAVGGYREHEARDAHDEQLAERDDPDAEDLAGQQLARRGSC